jgi:hypothetical protein
MAGFNAIPAASGGGGGIPSMNFIGSIFLSTFSRSWAQGGTSGNYAIYSANQENGYAYFVGSSVTTGIPLNKMGAVNHAFTSINIVGIGGDLISLYKVKVKTTTQFTQGLSDFPYSSLVTGASATVSTTQAYSVPSNALSLVNVLIVGGGGAAGAGHGGTHGGGGGGGGGNIVKLTGVQPPVPIQITIGAGGTSGSSNDMGNPGGTTFFGNFYALGGGGGGSWNNRPGGIGGNGGGAGAGNISQGGSGTSQGSASGLGTAGLLPPAGHGGNAGGAVSDNSSGLTKRGGGGGGAGGIGGTGSDGSGGAGGPGLVSDMSGSNVSYAPGGYGVQPNGGTGAGWSGTPFGAGGQDTINGHSNSSGQIGSPGRSGVVVVRYYTT